MRNFIEVTNKKDGTKILINTNLIKGVYTSKGDAAIDIGSLFDLEPSESYEQIKNMLLGE